MKKCTNCFQMKPLDSFYVKRALGPNGRQHRCKACNAEVVAGYYKRAQERKRAEKWARIRGETGST